MASDYRLLLLRFLALLVVKHDPRLRLRAVRGKAQNNRAVLAAYNRRHADHLRHVFRGIAGNRTACQLMEARHIQRNRVLRPRPEIVKGHNAVHRNCAARAAVGVGAHHENVFILRFRLEAYLHTVGLVRSYAQIGYRDTVIIRIEYVSHSR